MSTANTPRDPDAAALSALAPALLGVATILLPCGVTLSVEALALASGSPWQGAAIMAVFVAGTAAAAWTFFGCAGVALVLDGLDGVAARRSGLSSPFGARFDMETDAFMILVLSVIAFLLGKAGIWVIAGGLLRYLYVLAALVVPALARPLAPAWRRKVIAVIQGAALAAVLAPAVAVSTAPWVAAAPCSSQTRCPTSRTRRRRALARTGST